MNVIVIFPAVTSRAQEHSFRRLKSEIGQSVPSQEKICLLLVKLIIR